jgi:hypothetical protein
MISMFSRFISGKRLDWMIWMSITFLFFGGVFHTKRRRLERWYPSPKLWRSSSLGVERYPGTPMDWKPLQMVTWRWFMAVLPHHFCCTKKMLHITSHYLRYDHNHPGVDRLWHVHTHKKNTETGNILKHPYSISSRMILYTCYILPFFIWCPCFRKS